MWQPDGIIITGDLTEAKTPAGKGEQQKAEWRVGGLGSENCGDARLEEEWSANTKAWHSMAWQ